MDTGQPGRIILPAGWNFGHHLLQKNLAKSQNFTNVVMLLMNIFSLHIITCLSITKWNIIIIISINIIIYDCIQHKFFPQK